jgi:hypothetical protein
MNTPKGEASRGEFATDTDAAPIADADIRQVPRWDPSVDYASKDAAILRIAPAETSGEYVCPGYERGSDPKQLEDVAPAAFYDTTKLHTFEIPDLIQKHERKP